jgi:hypothetical protein
MSDTETVVRIEDKGNAPAVWLPGWMPDLDVFPELTEARDELHRTRAAWYAAGERRHDLQERVEGEAERRKTALRAAYLAGEQNAQVQDDGPELRLELAAAAEQSQAALEAYIECINRVIIVVVEHQEDWLGEITEFQEGVDSAVQALIDQATALRAKRGNFGRLEHWIQRTVSGAQTPYDHFPYSDIPAPFSGDPDEEEARLRAFMLASYAGGLRPDKPVSDERMAEVVERNAASQRRSPVADGQEAEIELNDLDAHELAEWIMGVGIFDGNAKPTAALVIEAATDGGPEFAARMLQAERLANPEAKRQDVLDRLTEITKGT